MPIQTGTRTIAILGFMSSAMVGYFIPLAQEVLVSMTVMIHIEE
jgi:hypothetical protein